MIRLFFFFTHKYIYFQKIVRYDRIHIPTQFLNAMFFNTNNTPFLFFYPRDELIFIYLMLTIIRLFYVFFRNTIYSKLIQPHLSPQKKKTKHTNHRIAPPFDEQGETESFIENLTIRINNTNQYIPTLIYTMIRNTFILFNLVGDQRRDSSSKNGNICTVQLLHIHAP